MKTGLLFGSFNPVHVGHLIIANYFASQTDLNEVWLVVTPHNPLKEKKSLLDNNHRLALVRLAIGENRKLKASNIEFKLQQPNYTIKTLTYLNEKYPARQFVLIMGADNLSTLHKWYNYEQILQNYELYVYPRPDDDGGELKNHKNVKVVSGVPIMQISSSEIRKAIKEKKSVQYLIPDAALEYLKEMHFYEK